MAAINAVAGDFDRSFSEENGVDLSYPGLSF